jgi:hypothetical protein
MVGELGGDGIFVLDGVRNLLISEFRKGAWLMERKIEKAVI